jgi:hypothetical protein
MIEAKDFWNNISNDVKEYLSMRYYGLTRCLLMKQQIEDISDKEVAFINILETKPIK